MTQSTILHTGCARLCALGEYLRRRCFFAPLREQLTIAQKTVRYRPMDKVLDALVGILGGAKTIAQSNVTIRTDPAVQRAFGRTACADQSTIARTLRACTGEQALLGPDAPGLSPATLSRLKQGWQEELAQWQQRDLTGKRYVYFWVDCVYLETRLDDARHRILVIIGADVTGHKELVGLWDGYRESEQSWKELLLDLQSRGLAQAPALAIGDGALGFWKAVRHVYGQTRWQRCWVHKTANVVDKLPKDLQPQAKQRLQAIWMAPDRQRAEIAFNLFIAIYEAKYPKAAECLAQNREVLLAFYDFPAEHWGHIRMTNPIASTFATVRARTDKTRGCLSCVTMLAMVFKLYQSAAKRWHRLRAAHYLTEVMHGIVFKDGLRVEQDAA